MSRAQVLLVMMLLSVWAAACAPAPAQPASTATPTLPPPTATVPAPPVMGEAQVESVEVVILESLPVQARAIVRGSLPDACTELGEITSVYEAGLFQITLKTTRPAEAVCAQMLAPFETSVTLPVDGLPAAPYTVSANGVRARFALPGAPAADPGGLPAESGGAIPSTVIIQDYAADQAAADARYKDQTLLIRGRITNLNDVFGTMALLLRDSESEVGLQCYLADNADAEKVKVGDEVVVQGRVRGGELGFFMVADECAVVEVK